MEIRPANSKNDLIPVAGLLGQTFASDPVLLESIFGYREPPADPKRAARVLSRVFKLELETLYLPHGRVDLAEEDGTLLGAALWLPPGASPGIGTRLLQGPRLIRALGRHFLRAALLDRYWTRATPKFPHWYLYTLAANPKARGKGVGSALLRHGLEQTGAMPIYLEATTERAAALYERNGFVRLGIIPTPLAAKEIGMWRPANGSENKQ